jgi:RNA 3'-terminal phosphate cyclase-like protein
MRTCAFAAILTVNSGLRRYIYTDNYRGAEAGKSPGFGLSMVAESTTGALSSAECIARPAELPEDLGQRAAKSLLAEIARGGCVDTQHQAMCLLLMALCPEDLSKVRMGKGLTKYSIQYLRDIRTFIGTTFRIKPDDETGTTLFSCIGSGYTNVSKKAA